MKRCFTCGRDVIAIEGERSDSPAFQILRQTVQRAMDANVLRAGEANTYSDLLWAVTHGIVSLAISFPVFDAARVQLLIETWNQTLSHGLRSS